jgi:hypothetical protein
MGAEWFTTAREFNSMSKPADQWIHRTLSRDHNRRPLMILRRLRMDRSGRSSKKLQRAISGLCGVILFWAILRCVYSQEIPAGFNVKRYASIWERNPFTLVTPAAPKVQASAFAKLNLMSWLIEGAKEVVCVENSETKDVQTIAAEPNQNNMRLITLRLNPDPRLVEAVISDGNELGTVKFRCDAPIVDPRIPAQSPAIAGSQPSLVPSKTSDSRQDTPVNQRAPYRIYPGMPRVYHEGGVPGQSSAAAPSRRKHALEAPSPAQ